MASQIISLGNVPGDTAWAGAILIDASLVSGGGVAYLRLIELVGSSSRLSTSVNTTDDAALAGPELTSAWELYASALVFDDADGNSLTLKGPAHPDNSFIDDSEQYFWTPDNFADWNAYWNEAHTALTLTLTDAPAGTTTDHAVDAGGVNWTFDIPQASVTHTPAPSFDEVTVDIGSANVTATLLVWSQGVDLGATFDADGLGQTLTQTVIYYSGGLAGTVNLSIDGNNNRFTRAFEQTGRIIFEATSTGETLEVMIADADMEEPYSWIPSNSAEVLAFATHVLSLSDRSATLTLRIGMPATNHTVNAGDVSWAFHLPQPTVTHTLAAPLLTLADFDTTGLTVDAAALLVASAPGTTGNNPYADSDRGDTDSPLDGELGLSTAETVISRIRRHSATELNLNDNDSPSALDIGAYFAAGGDGNDLTLYLQTASDGLVSFAVAGQLTTSGGNFARFTLPAAAQTLLDNLDTGDRWLFAFARPLPAPVNHVVDAGGVNWTFDVPQVTVTHTRAAINHAVDAGVVSWVFDLPQPTVTHTTLAPTNHTVNAGGVSWTFDIPQPSVTRTPGGTSHAVDAGGVSWTFEVVEPTVTHTPAGPVRTVDAGGVSWTFSVPEPTVTHTPARSRPTVTPLEASISLLLSQWQDRPNLEALLSIWLTLVEEEFINPLYKLNSYRNIDLSEGIWLDRIGERLNAIRPYITVTGQGERFGFDMAGVGFMQGRMADAVSLLEPRAPAGDALYRRILRAKAKALRSLGELDAFELSLRCVDPAASVYDGRDMSFAVSASLLRDILAAWRVGAFPLPAGIQYGILEEKAYSFAAVLDRSGNNRGVLTASSLGSFSPAAPQIPSLRTLDVEGAALTGLSIVGATDNLLRLLCGGRWASAAAYGGWLLTLGTVGAVSIGTAYDSLAGGELRLQLTSAQGLAFRTAANNGDTLDITFEKS